MNKLLFIIFFLPSFGFAQSLAQQGWPLFFRDLYENLERQPTKNYVILTTLFPTKTMDLRTGNGIRDSLSQSYSEKNLHPGHQMIGWKCNLNGFNYTSFMGFNGEMGNQMRQMLEGGWGLTSLISTFTDGYLESPRSLDGRFQTFQKAFEMKAQNRQFMMSTVFEISANDCNDLINEVYNYESHPQNPVKNFSLAAHPQNYEGAVCNSFALHLLSSISQFRSLPQDLTRRLSFPATLFGKTTALPKNVSLPQKTVETLKNRRVSLFELAGSDWSPAVSRSQQTQPNVSLDLIDPELLILWQKTYFQTYFQRSSLVGSPEEKWFQRQTHRGFWEKIKKEFDPISQQNYIEIDSNFDDQTRNVSNKATSSIMEKKLRYLRSNPFPILIIETNNP